MNRFAKGRVARGQVPASSSSQLEGLEPRQLFAVIPVTSTANTVDPNDGVTTLREAITQANNQTGADVIQLASGATYTLNAVDNTSFGDTGLPLVSSEITVEGNGATVARSGAAGTPAFRLFAVDGGGGQLTLNNLTLTGGLSKGGGGGPGGGGGAGMGGAVYTEGRLRLSGVLVVGNTAKGGFGGVRSDDAGAGGQLGGSGGREGDPAGANGIGEPGAFGGGGGKGTTGKGGDGGFGGGGGATGSSSDANRGLAGFGGGRGNVSNGAGGGGAGLGGGVFANANTSVDIVNSTFANNTAEGGSGHQAGRGLGGAIFVADGFVDLLNNTISNNTADAGRGLYLGPSTGSQFLAYNNIFGQTNNAVPDIASAGDEIRGRNNLVRNATGALMSPDFNQSTADPKLGPLANNGGLTRTFALLNGSLAINSGFTEITQLEGLTVDQRGPGFGRIEGPAVDVGALESTGVFPPSVVTIGNASVAEGNDGIRLMTFTVTRSGDTSSAAAVDYRTFSGSAAAGDDYNDASGTLTFAPGVTTRTFTVQVRGDGVAEQDETFTAMLWRPSGVALGSQLQGVGTIVNDDGPLGATPNISIANASTFEGNSGTKLLTFTLTRSGDVSAASTVGFNTANVSAGEGDYGPTSGTVTFAAGETSKTISVVVKGDTKVENDEVFRVLLSSATNATLANTFADGTIVNDDGANAPPTIAVANASTAEGNSGTKQLLFTVTLNKAWNQTITVDFVTRNQTAGEGDYAPTSGTITFAAGQTSRTIAITIKGDTKVENDETFAIDLSNAVNATIGDALGIGTIRNDD